MKKLLYIIANSKPENLSASRTVARSFINKFMGSYKDFQVEELDLYQASLPLLRYQYFDQRNQLVNNPQLPPEDQKAINTINSLCDQFISADVYVIAAPMWNLSFPAPLKQYIDCIVQAGKTVDLSEGNAKGLLNDRKRAVVYIQSSGANIPWIIGGAYRDGINYVKDIMDLLGIENFEKLLVDGTGYTEEEKQTAIQKANEDIDNIINSVAAEEELVPV